MNEMEKEKHREKQRQMRAKLQEINRERDQYIKDKHEEWEQDKKDLANFSQKLVDIDNESVEKEKKNNFDKRMNLSKT